MAEKRRKPPAYPVGRAVRLTYEGCERVGIVIRAAGPGQTDVRVMLAGVDSRCVNVPASELREVGR